MIIPSESLKKRETRFPKNFIWGHPTQRLSQTLSQPLYFFLEYLYIRRQGIKKNRQVDLPDFDTPTPIRSQPQQQRKESFKSAAKRRASVGEWNEFRGEGGRDVRRGGGEGAIKIHTPGVDCDTHEEKAHNGTEIECRLRCCSKRSPDRKTAGWGCLGRQNIAFLVNIQ